MMAQLEDELLDGSRSVGRFCWDWQMYDVSIGVTAKAAPANSRTTPLLRCKTREPIIACQSVDYAAFAVENLSLIQDVVRLVARRHWLSADEADDLAGSIRLKLVENDYEVLRKFEGRSQLRTYLTTVVERHFLDERNARWGKWRPSAQARRLGVIATLLDQLVTRDNLAFDEAVIAIHARHGNAVSREDLHKIVLQLPVRSSRHFVGEELLENVAAPVMVRDATELAIVATVRKVVVPARAATAGLI